MVRQVGIVVLMSTLLVALFSSRADARRGCICTANYEPVCGSNGKTYSNLCNFECANWNGRLSYTQGSCESASYPTPPSFNQPCACTMDYTPVCGSNGQTYSNLCGFECANRDVYNGRLSQTAGSCESAEQGNDDQNCMCTLEYRPVCGSNGQTYSNLCNFKCANRDGRMWQTEGSCESGEQESQNCICTMEYRPVCGSNGKTYSNLCNFECENRAQYGGSMRSTDGSCQYDQNVGSYPWE